VDVKGVLGKKTMMPCDITPRDRDDAVYMVLWFKEADGEPLYRSVACRCTQPALTSVVNFRALEEIPFCFLFQGSNRRVLRAV
jgi:hypothetical protein